MGVVGTLRGSSPQHEMIQGLYSPNHVCATWSHMMNGVWSYVPSWKSKHTGYMKPYWWIDDQPPIAGYVCMYVCLYVCMSVCMMYIYIYISPDFWPWQMWHFPWNCWQCPFCLDCMRSPASFILYIPYSWWASLILPTFGQGWIQPPNFFGPMQQPICESSQRMIPSMVEKQYIYIYVWMNEYLTPQPGVCVVSRWLLYSPIIHRPSWASLASAPPGPRHLLGFQGLLQKLCAEGQHSRLTTQGHLASWRGWWSLVIV